jgi:2-dehydropantoate 2-reductase
MRWFVLRAARRGQAAHSPPAPLFARAGAGSFTTMAAGRILIAGAGAIGSMCGAMLAAGGHQVTMLGRTAHLDAIEAHGLRLSGIFGAHTVRNLILTDHPARLGGRFDLILCTVKSYDTESLAGVLADRLEDRGTIVSMQNGLGNIETLAAHFGHARVLGARVITGAEFEGPGAVRVTVSAEPIAIGPAPQVAREATAALAERAREITEVIDRSGIPSVAVADVMPVIWAKLLYNVALNPLGALLGLHYGALAKDADLRTIMDAAIGEAFAVARLLDIALPFADAGAYREFFYQRLIPPTFHHRPSMLYDLRRRGRTEIGALNGRIVELANELGLRADANAMLVKLVRAAERARSAELEKGA